MLDYSFGARKIVFPGWLLDVDRHATCVQNTRNRLLFYRVSLRNHDIRFGVEIFDQNWKSPGEKSRVEKKKIFKTFRIVPNNVPMLHKSHLMRICHPEDPNPLKNRSFFMPNLDFGLAFHGFPCQNFIPSSRHAYRRLKAIFIGRFYFCLSLSRT